MARRVSTWTFANNVRQAAGSDCITLLSDVVISGKCGKDVTVLYRAEDKVIGRFTGDVECFTRQSA